MRKRRVSVKIFALADGYACFVVHCAWIRVGGLSGPNMVEPALARGFQCLKAHGATIAEKGAQRDISRPTDGTADTAG